MVAMSEFAHPERLAGLRARMATPETHEGKTVVEAVDALIVSHLDNVRYLTGFTGSNGLVLLTAESAFFFTDGRYALQAAREVPGFERIILPPGSSLIEAAGKKVITLGGLSLVGFEGARLTYNAYRTLELALDPDAALCCPISRSGDVEHLRERKDATEIAKIRAACALADACFEYLLTRIRPGVTERSLAWDLEVFFRTHGAQRLSFDPIVGSGPNSALIHGRASDRVLGSSGGPEFVLCDFGCELDGYCSDITRTVVVGGEPTERMRQIYETTLSTQLAALAVIQPGAKGKEVDALARGMLKEAGFGEMPHGLGHGLGRLVHDLPLPTFSPMATVTLREGMVVTVEPGIYVEGLGGVRIEDDVLVTPTGCERLTHATKELIVLGN